ncbi:hypothetical protein ACQCP0_18995 [Ralstonia pseudosolanacearum]|uniref:hypothetical protein n=1 Tax=Ralstonia pseudosolanacearum TaxID=1310165 RepID=UPI0021FC86F5|nr:hypothetical protein NHF34_00960 [Ralstonia solanacearum]
MNSQNPINNDQLEREIAKRELYRKSLEGWWERLTQRGSEWDLETVKHLVVLNAAGIAGVATLLAGAGKGLLAAWVGPSTLLCYGLGVILAILNMYLVSVRFGLMAGEIKARITKTWELSERMDHIFDDLTAGRRLGIAGQVCGWGSAVLAVASTVALCLSLVK